MAVSRVAPNLLEGGRTRVLGVCLGCPGGPDDLRKTHWCKAHCVVERDKSRDGEGSVVKEDTHPPAYETHCVVESDNAKSRDGERMML